MSDSTESKEEALATPTSEPAGQSDTLDTSEKKNEPSMNTVINLFRILTQIFVELEGNLLKTNHPHRTYQAKLRYY